MPAGHIHRRLMGGGQSYLELLQSQGAQWFFPFDDTMEAQPATDTVDEDIGTFNTSASAIYTNLTAAITFQQAKISTVSDSAVKLLNASGDGVQCVGMSDAAGGGGSLSFWMQTDITAQILIGVGFNSAITTDNLHINHTAKDFRWSANNGAVGTVINQDMPGGASFAAGIHIGMVCWPDGGGGTDSEMWVNGQSIGTDNEATANNIGVLNGAMGASGYFKFTNNDATKFLKVQGFAGAQSLKWVTADFLAQYNNGKI